MPFLMKAVCKYNFR